MNHVIYLKLRKKWLLFKADKFTKWQIFSLNAINFSAVLQIFITNYAAAANAEIIFWNWSNKQLEQKGLGQPMQVFLSLWLQNKAFKMVLNI